MLFRNAQVVDPDITVTSTANGDSFFIGFKRFKLGIFQLFSIITIFSMGPSDWL